jgi:superfamily II DNA or RNA helicase
MLSIAGYEYTVKTEHEVEKIKSELCVTPKVNELYEAKEEPFECFIELEENKKYIVPRYWGLKHFGKANMTNIEQYDKINVEFTGELRDYQIDVVSMSLKKIHKNGGGILQLPCGYGKTTIAIHLICHLKVKTLIIVHKGFLIDQWIQRIKQFSNASIGMIRANTIDIENKDIVLATIQSISMKNYDAFIFEKFGLVVYDEAHRSGSRVFSQAFQKTNFRYTLGLSATPYRADGLTKLIMWSLGNVIYKIERKEKVDVIVKRIFYFSRNKLFAEKRRYVPNTEQLVSNFPKMITNICNIDGRNKFILDIMIKLLENPDRKILVIGSRVEHLETMKQQLDTIIDDDIKTYLYVGKTKEYDRREAEELADVLFSTYSMAEEGLDIDRLNTLIMVCPKTKIEQTVGRILRKTQNKSYSGPLPLVIDLCDDLGEFVKQAYQRKNYYNRLKYKSDMMFAIENKLVSNRQYIKYKLKLDDSDPQLEEFDSTESNMNDIEKLCK